MGSPSSRLYMVRHGIVEPRWRGRLYGDLDVPLDPEGRLQAQGVANRLAATPLHLVASSNLERALFGARCLAEGRGLDPRIDPRLRELSRGSWAGMDPADLEVQSPGALAAWRRDPGHQRPPGGESLGDLCERVYAALDDLSRDAAEAADLVEAPHPQAAAVAHGWVLRCAALAALGLPPEAAEALSVPPASILALDWPQSGHRRAVPILAGFNLDRPLQGSPAWYRLASPG